MLALAAELSRWAVARERAIQGGQKLDPAAPQKARSIAETIRSELVELRKSKDRADVLARRTKLLRNAEDGQAMLEDETSLNPPTPTPFDHRARAASARKPSPAPPGPAAPTPSGPAGQAAGQPGPIRVLLVDGDPHLAQVARARLPKDVELFHAGSVDDAVKLLPAVQPKLLVADWGTTGERSVELLRETARVAPKAARAIVGSAGERGAQMLKSMGAVHAIVGKADLIEDFARRIRAILTTLER